jgi:hypothetical protein
MIMFCQMVPLLAVGDKIISCLEKMYSLCRFKSQCLKIMVELKRSRRSTSMQ